VFVVAQMTPQEPGSAPDFDMPGGNAKPLGHFVKGQHSPFTQAVEAALQVVFDHKAGDHAATEWLPVAGAETSRVQDAGNGLIGMFIQQPIDLGYDTSLRHSRTARKRQFEGFRGSSRKSDMNT
jgi:hypothetical protein